MATSPTITCPEYKGRGWFIDSGPLGDRFDCSECEGIGTWEGLVVPPVTVTVQMPSDEIAAAFADTTPGSDERFAAAIARRYPTPALSSDAREVA